MEERCIDNEISKLSLQIVDVGFASEIDSRW